MVCYNPVDVPDSRNDEHLRHQSLSGSVEAPESHTGCSSAWLERYVRDVEAAGSNPVIPIRNPLPDIGLRFSFVGEKCGLNRVRIWQDFCNWRNELNAMAINHAFPANAIADSFGLAKFDGFSCHDEPCLRGLMWAKKCGQNDHKFDHQS